MISNYLVNSVFKLMDAYTFFTNSEILLGYCETKTRMTILMSK